MKKQLFNALLMLLIGALFVLATPIQGHAQYFRLAINELHAEMTHDRSWGNDDDELYFVLAGGTKHDGEVGVPRVSPDGDDHFSIQTGESLRDIPLWNGHWYYLGKGEEAYFTVTVRNRTNIFNLLDNLTTIVRGFGALVISYYLTPYPLAWTELNSRFQVDLESLDNDGDHTVGAYSVYIRNGGGKFFCTWTALNKSARIETRLKLGKNDDAASFQLTGYDSSYLLTASVQRLAASIVNKNSLKCLDVAGASTADQANVQQFGCHGGQIQQWVYKPMEYTSGNPAQPYSIINAYTGKCLDVAGASLADGANVQQYACHGGNNQIWYLYYLLDGNYQIRNKKSLRVLDVADSSRADGGNVQQFTWKSGDNQKWWINW